MSRSSSTLGMKTLIYIILVTNCINAFAEEISLATFKYELHINSQIHLQGSEIENPFASEQEKKVIEKERKERELRKRKKPTYTSIEEGITQTAGIEITEENKKYLLYDGEALYARVAPDEHKRLSIVLNLKGQEVSKEAELKVLELLESKKKDPNQTH